MQVVSRTIYFDRIRIHIGKPVIKVITGLRRSGKSYMMIAVIAHIKKTDANANIISVNKEDIEFDYMNDYRQLQNYFDKEYKPDRNNYLFIDEVQEIQSFEKCLRNILLKGLADIYITGSNASVMSGELASMLSGRYIEINIHPLSYPEYLDFYGSGNPADDFSEYLKRGGMPGLTQTDLSERAIRDYLNGILSTVLLKDVVARFNIRNVTLMNNLLRFIGENTGSLLTAKSISDYLKSQQIKVTPNVVLDYLGYLASSFITSKVQRKDVTGKKVFEIGEKHFFADTGLRNLLTGFKPGDMSKLLENTVYNHLVIAGYQVYVGQMGHKEIDFVAERNGETIYIQVCYLLSSEQVINREFGNLLEIKDNYMKIVTSMDAFGDINSYKGIMHFRIPQLCEKLLRNEF